MLDLPYPNINGETNEKKLAQINAYLIQLKDALEFALIGMSSENQSMSETLSKSLNASNVEREDQLKQVSSKITSDSDGAMSAIEQTAEAIRTEVRQEYELKTDAKEMYKELSSSIEQTAEEISLEVSKKVDADEVVSSINVSSDAIELKSNRISIDSTNFTLSKEGNVVANSLTSKNASITGGSINISSVTKNVYPIKFTGIDGRTIEIGPYNVTMKDGEYFTEIGPQGISVGQYDMDGSMSNADIFYNGNISAIGVYKTTTTDAPNVHVMSNGYMKRSTSSSERYKRDITEELSDALNPQKLYALPVKSYKYKDDYLSESDTRYQKDIIGFIAEDVAEIYECAVQYNEKGQPEMWNSNVMIPALLKLIQEQNERIKALEEKI
jgi:hypothetical protein